MLTLLCCLSAATKPLFKISRCQKRIRLYGIPISSLPYVWAYYTTAMSIQLEKSNRGPIALLATSEQNTSCWMFMAKPLTLKINEWFEIDLPTLPNCKQA